jgi:hypothetical protein
LAGFISGQTGVANVGPEGVNGARRRNADIAYESRAAIAITPHSPQSFIDEFGRELFQRRLILQ